MIRLLVGLGSPGLARFGRSLVLVTCACLGLPAGVAAADQSLSLREGWNLISLSTDPGSASVEEVLAGLPPSRLVRVYGFDGNLGANFLPRSGVDENDGPLLRIGIAPSPGNLCPHGGTAGGDSQYDVVISFRSTGRTGGKIRLPVARLTTDSVDHVG